MALWDSYPVSPGHALIVPRRHVASLIESTAMEREAILRLVDKAHQLIAERYAPDAFNLGINDIRYFRIGNHRHASLMQMAHHDLAIDEILGATEGNETDFDHPEKRAVTL